MPDKYTIEGLQDCERFFDAQPANILKVTRKAMGAGGRAGAKAIRSGVDKRYAYLVRSKVSKTRDGQLSALVGLYNRGEVDGTQPKQGEVPTFYKAYWRNYGTLEGRDPSHAFRYPVKPPHYSTTRRQRNRQGEQHSNFFENAAQGAPEVFMDAFENYLDQHSSDLYAR